MSTPVQGVAAELDSYEEPISAATREAVATILANEDKARIQEIYDFFVAFVGDVNASTLLSQFMVSNAMTAFSNTHLQSIDDPTIVGTLSRAIRHITGHSTGTFDILKELLHNSLVGFSDRTGATSIKFIRNADGTTSTELSFSADGHQHTRNFYGRADDDSVTFVKEQETQASGGVVSDHDHDGEGDGDNGKGDGDKGKDDGDKGKKNNDNDNNDDDDEDDTVPVRRHSRRYPRRPEDTQEKMDIDEQPPAQTKAGKPKPSSKKKKSSNRGTITTDPEAKDKPILPMKLKMSKEDPIVPLGPKAKPLLPTTQRALERASTNINAMDLSATAKAARIAKLYNGCRLLQTIFSESALQLMIDRIHSLSDWVAQSKNPRATMSGIKSLTTGNAEEQGNIPDIIKQLATTLYSQTTLAGEMVSTTMYIWLNRLEMVDRWETLKAAAASDNEDDYREIWKFITDSTGITPEFRVKGQRTESLLRRALLLHTYGISSEAASSMKDHLDTLNNKLSKTLQESKGLKVFTSQLSIGMLFLLPQDGWKDICYNLPREDMEMILTEVKENIPELQDIERSMNVLVANRLRNGEYPIINLVPLGVTSVDQITVDMCNWHLLTQQARTDVSNLTTGLAFNHEYGEVGTRLLPEKPEAEAAESDHNDDDEGEPMADVNE